jgi:hypothetical protein
MLAIHMLALSLALHLRTSSGFSFTIDNAPQQCTDLNISIVGSGYPPYSAVIVPYGSTPLPNQTDIRNVIIVPFIDGSTSTSFQLTYPENSQFVIVASNLTGNGAELVRADKLPQVSDSAGFGTGGVSVAIQVQTGSDSSCYGDSEVNPLFTFSTTPNNQLTQCTPTRIYWDHGVTQG